MIPVILILEATIAIIREIITIEKRQTFEGKMNFILKQLSEEFPNEQFEIKEVEELVDYVIVNKLHIDEKPEEVKEVKNDDILDVDA